MHRRFLLFLFCLGVCLPAGRAAPAGNETAPAMNWGRRFEQAQDLLKLGKTDESLALGLETVQQASALSTMTNPESLVAAQSELAQLYLRCHRFAEAEKILTQIVQEQEAAYGAEDTRVAQALYDLGWYYSNLSKYAKAKALLQRALEIDEKKLGRRHRQTALVLNSLGVLAENEGDYTSAATYFLEAIDIQTQTLGAENLTTATTVNNLATLYWSQGDYRQAEKYFSQALAVRERLRGRGSLVTATTINNLALVYMGMGDYQRAETFFWRTLRIREHKLGVNHPLTQMTVNHLGLLYYDLKDYPAAESFLLRAALSREKVIGADQPDTARAIFHLACLYDTMGQYAKAEPLHQRALDIRLRIMGTNHPETAASYGYLARHHHLMGQHDKALPLYQQALDSQRIALGRDHPDRLKTLENFSCLHLDLGQRDQAATLIKEASGIRERQMQNLLLFTSDQQRIDFQKTLNFYNLSASLGNASALAQVVYRTKGLVLDSLIEDQTAARASLDPETKALQEKLRTVLSSLEKSNPGKEEELEREADRLRASLGERLQSGHASCHALQTSPSAVAAAVPKRSALVEFIRYQAYQKNLQFIPSYGALVQAHGQPLLWVPLGAAQDIEKSVALYQKFVRRRVRDAAIGDVLKQLHQRVWEPIDKALPADCQRVILSPDAELNPISFATLLSEKDQFLCERYAIEYISSARDLLVSNPEHRPSGGTIAIFAAPDFGKGDSKGTATNSIKLAPLPQSRQEANFLQKNAPSWGLTPTIYTGTKASEINLSQLPAPTILHIATHGLYWNGEPKKNPPTDLQEISPRESRPNPMKRSLLAFAGAQATLDAWQKGIFPPSDEDGVLTAQEVGTLNLHGTWLVVLSACDTGIGQTQAGEGVLGLRRGFLLAGAQNLLMTLWPVGDAETAAFMADFYQLAMQKQNAAQALSTVQQQQLTKIRQDKGLWSAVTSAGAFILSY